jgi:hypothetical protein
MANSIIIGQGGSGVGGGSSTNLSVGPNGGTGPTSSTQIGDVVAGVFTPFGPSNPIPISGTITASNPSVGATGSAAPAFATEIGVINAGGLLEGASASNPVRIDPTGTTVQPVSGTITALQGTSPWVVSGTVTATIATPTDWGTAPATSVLVPAVNAELFAGQVLLAAAPASTVATAVQTSLVVQVSPNQPSALFAGTVPGTPPLNTILTGMIYNSSAPAPTAGQTLPLQSDVVGNLKVTVATSPSTPLNDNIAEWGSVAVAAATNTMTVGTESAPVVRPIQAKHCVILTTTPLAANGVFTSASGTGPSGWFDTEVTGDTFVFARALSNVGSANPGFAIQVSDDPTNAGLTQALAQVTTSANVVGTVNCSIPTRYWRIVYTNGATLQTTFELAVVSGPMGAALLGQGIVTAAGATYNLTPVWAVQNNTVGDASTANGWENSSGLASAAAVAVGYTTGPQSAGANYSAARTPNIFHTASVPATASGNTAVWTPTSGKKFRLMRFQITATDLSATAAALLTISFQDATTAIGIGTYDVWIPATASLASGITTVSAWVDIGNGYLSTTINNVLNANISATLSGATGTFRVNVCGTEE